MAIIQKSEKDDIASMMKGMTEEEAEFYAVTRGWHTRVVSRDGVDFAITLDYHLGRINLYIKKGKVKKVDFG